MYKFVKIACEAEPVIKEEFENILKRTADGQSRTLAYVEALKNDRREKRKRYKKNKVLKKEFEEKMKGLCDDFTKVTL